MDETLSLYERDTVLWSEEQAAAIRAAARLGSNLPLDWENIAEEIESLGKSLKHELLSRTGTVVEHLLKLQHSTAIDPRPKWIETVGRERVEIDDLLDDNPSLRPALPEVVARAHNKGLKLAILSLSTHGELPPTLGKVMARTRFTADQVLGDWLPDGPEPT